MISLISCRRAEPQPARARDPIRQPATYVGINACVGCHAEQAQRYSASDHARAMQTPTAQTVLGSFNSGQTVEAPGESLRFIQDGPDYAVEVTRGDAAPVRYPVRYVFGVDPLQQLLLDVGQGRLQALTTAWDARPAELGGQRWFNLQADAAPGDALHWQGSHYNWNLQCADCHSTAVERGYSPDGHFDTRFAAAKVSCEACHGPGSAHVEWARSGASARDHGLQRPLTKADARRWVLDPGAPIARLSTAPARAELDSCAPCHARRAKLGPGRGEGFDDRYRLALLDRELYFDDGQIRDEVFVYGSFLQSKMYAAGVVCSDCHEPHSLELRAATVSQTCASCHRPEVFAQPSHHMHAQGSEAARCESCHMPERVYMGVDGRRDHRFSVPRPLLSARVGAPDPCLGCHDTQRPEWAQDKIEATFGPRPARWDFATALWLAREQQPGAAAALEQVIDASHGPAIIRATALVELAAYPSPRSLQTVRSASEDKDALLRRAAATTASSLPQVERESILRSLLRDPSRSVRLEAVAGLLGADTRSWPAPAREALEAALAEYRALERYDAARVEALVDLAALELRAGQPERAREQLEQAIARDPTFTPAPLNLADLYRTIGREADAEAVLRRAITQVAEPALVHHALGLTLVRIGRSEAALVELRRAHELAPADVRLGYVYAVALFDGGRHQAALATLETFHRQYPGNRDVLEALASFSQQLGQPAQAAAYAAKLAKL